MAMVAQTSHQRDPLAEKLKPEHVTRVLRLGEQQERHEYDLRRQAQLHQILIAKLVAGLAAFAVVAVLILCWLFFAYGKADQVSTIITMLIVGSGGVGIGTGLRRLTPKVTRDTEEPPQA